MKHFEIVVLVVSLAVFSACKVPASESSVSGGETMPSGDLNQPTENSKLGNKIDLALNIKDLLMLNLTSFGAGKLVELINSGYINDQVREWMKEFDAGLRDLSSFKCSSGMIADETSANQYTKHWASRIKQAYEMDAPLVLHILNRATFRGDPNAQMRSAELSLIGAEISQEVKTGVVARRVCRQQSVKTGKAQPALGSTGFEGKKFDLNVWSKNTTCEFADGNSYRINRIWGTIWGGSVDIAFEVDGYVNWNAPETNIAMVHVNSLVPQIAYNTLTGDGLARLIELAGKGQTGSWKVISCQ